MLTESETLRHCHSEQNTMNNTMNIYEILPLGFVSVGLNFLPGQGFGFAAKPIEGTTNQATTSNLLFIRTSGSSSCKTNRLSSFSPSTAPEVCTTAKQATEEIQRNK